MKFSQRRLIAATLLPFAAAAIALIAIGQGFHPYADQAQLELRIRDLPHEPILTGPFSDGIKHPGPMIFYILAVPYWLSAMASVGIYIGVVLINAASVAGMALIARRLGGRPMFIATVLCLGLLVRSLGPDFIRDPWSPYITVLPFGLLLFLSWAMTCGEAWALPVGAVVATFVIQSEVGYTVMAVPLLTWGAAWLLVKTRRSLPLTLGVLVVLWALPIYEQLTAKPGNLALVSRSFESDDQVRHSVGDGLRVLSAQFGRSPEWITGTKPWTLTFEPTALYATPVPLMVLPAVIAAVVLWRKGGANARRLLTTLGLALLLGVVAIAGTTGFLVGYRLVWAQVLGMSVGAMIVWAAGRTATRTTLVGLAILLVAGLNTYSVVRAGVPEEDRVSYAPGKPSDALAQLTPALVEALPPGDGEILVESSSFASAHYKMGLLLSLERAGVDARVSPDDPDVSSRRHTSGAPLRATVLVAANRELYELWGDSTLRFVASWGSVPSRPGPNDPVQHVESIWTPGAESQLRAAARDHVDKAGTLAAPHATYAVGAFLRR